MAIAILGDSADARLIHTLLAKVTSAELWRHGMDLLYHLRQQPASSNRYHLFLLDSDHIPLANALLNWATAPVFFFRSAETDKKPIYSTVQTEAVITSLPDCEIVEYQGPPKKLH